MPGSYDAEFLRRYCAVCDASGKIDSLYIALRHGSLSWHSIRRAPVVLEGLEECWYYDPILDQGQPFGDDDSDADDLARPSAGDILPFSSLKRTASEMSRSSSFGASAAVAAAATAIEGEGSRPKVPRTYTSLPNPMEVRSRGVKTS